jgi:hypothetical protein
VSKNSKTKLRDKPDTVVEGSVIVGKLCTCNKHQLFQSKDGALHDGFVPVFEPFFCALVF